MSPRIDYLSTVQLAIGCIGYFVLMLLVQQYSLVPSLDWLRGRVAALEMEVRIDEWHGRGEILDALSKFEKKIDRPPVFVRTSAVQAGWRLVHGIEANRTRHIPDEEARVQLEAAKSRLRLIDSEQAEELSDRIDDALDSNTNQSARDKELLREATAFRHNINDSAYEEMAAILQKAIWLTLIGLSLIFVFGAIFDRETLFVAGAAGGLISRMTRLLTRRPSSYDYGASWSSLLLSPVVGALAGWIGVVIITGLADEPVTVFDTRVATMSWSDPGSPLALSIAVLFGFSERLLNRVLTRAEEGFAGTLGKERSRGREDGRRGAGPSRHRERDDRRRGARSSRRQPRDNHT